MRIVILGSSVYSETACAMAVRLAEMGNVPEGALVLSTLNRGTVLRKLGQWGMRDAARYALAKVAPGKRNGSRKVLNRYLEPWLKHEGGVFHSLREVAEWYGFPVSTCGDQNAPNAIARLRKWSPDLIVFTGGNILRKDLLEVPRLGVLNVHLGLLPAIRGMSSPEWSLLQNVPVGVTIHYIDSGIDTGPILRKYELPDLDGSESLSDLRSRLIAFGIDKIAEVIADLGRGAISPIPQSHFIDSQFFVMHGFLRERAAERLARGRMRAAAGTMNG